MKIPNWLLSLTVFCTRASLTTPAATLYVSLESTNPAPPYATWATAAINIQNAVDAATTGDEVVVTNGVYAAGVAVTHPLTLRSVNGPQFTIVDGGGTTRCVWLGTSAVLSGFTLTNGHADQGGGVWCESSNVTVSNCVLTGNSAIYGGGGACGGTLYNCTLTGNSANFGSEAFGWVGQGGGVAGSILYNCALNGNKARNGGGACGSALYNCVLTGNSAVWLYLFDSGGGGGAFESTLNNCTVIGNWASYGGGAADPTLNNCILYYNTADNGPNYYYTGYDGAVCYNCCTTPLPLGGDGNITSAPLLVDIAGGNLRLQSNSPCINAGNNAYVSGTTDLDGRPRIVGRRVDMGAYEFQTPATNLFVAWLQQYHLPLDISSDGADPDDDGMNNWRERQADTNPTNAASVLRLTILSNTPPVAVTFLSSAARLYTLLCSTNLAPSSVWTPVPGQIDISGSGDVLILSDTNPPCPAFYRVSVRFP